MKFINRSLFILFLFLGSALYIFSGCSKNDDTVTPSGTVTDVDGNVYHTVTINNQVWMVENLKTTTLNDGITHIPAVSDATTWKGMTTPAYCWYSNDSVLNKNTYGALYNWYAVNTGKLCPQGWHIPTQDEWEALINFLGGDSIAGGALKESGTEHWVSPNKGATNSSGFTALPGGDRFTNSSFYLQRKYGWYWSATETSADDGWHIYLDYNSTIVGGKGGSKKIGFSVRCIKD